MRNATTRWIAPVVGAVVLAAAVACTSDGPTGGARGVGDPTAASTPARSPKWLFSVQSQGTSTFDAATGRLSMPADSVQAFTDRPYRDSRVVTPQAFANLFHQGGRNSFEKDPPNAVLTYWDETGTPRTAVCEASRGAGVEDGRLWVGLKVLEPVGATLPSTLPRASLFVDDVPLGGGCPNSPEDEDIIEYFNEIEFSEDIYVQIQDTGAAFQLSLNCPPQQSPSFPPPEMQITLATADGTSTISCNTGTITLTKAQMPQLVFCQATGSTCSFLVTVGNSATSAVYSTTEIMITFTNGNNTYIPDLNPAVIPLCPSNFNPCVLTGQCSLSTTKGAQLQLCEDAASCTLPGG
ncbi:MAG: hypothetical protein ACOYOP_11905 [Microthrixaceae bacterium]